jgi:hypothetical protein
MIKMMRRDVTVSVSEFFLKRENFTDNHVLVQDAPIPY